MRHKTIRILDHSLHSKAKAQAALLGKTLSEYIESLIKADIEKEANNGK